MTTTQEAPVAQLVEPQPRLPATVPLIPRKVLLKAAVITVIISGFLICAWSGGVLALWALFTATVAGFVAGVYLADKFK
jgi:hypothetical protein